MNQTLDLRFKQNFVKISLSGPYILSDGPNLLILDPQIAFKYAVTLNGVSRSRSYQTTQIIIFSEDILSPVSLIYFILHLNRVFG